MPYCREAVVQRCSVKKMFLEVSQNLQENTCARVSTLLKKKTWHRCFPVNFAKFLRTSFLQNTSGGCFCCYFLFTYFMYSLLFAVFIYVLFTNRYYNCTSKVRQMNNMLQCTKLMWKNRKKKKKKIAWSSCYLILLQEISLILYSIFFWLIIWSGML